ncbi:MAG: ABC transporter permease [Muribaculaceae bacterium]|nr:ABC transporter permease [Muribaculaceae bacterium]
MNHDLYIARRLKLHGRQQKGSPSLTVALVGIVLAVVVMILSIAIVMGFKGEISGKIMHLDAHLRVSNAALGIDENYATVNGREVHEAIVGDSAFAPLVESVSLIADKSAILKTDSDFMGIIMRGVDSGYDWRYLQSRLTEGVLPDVSDTASSQQIAISKLVANRLKLRSGDKVLTYFIDNSIKVRNLTVSGVFETDLDAFDGAYIVGGIGIVQGVNGWNGDTGTQVAVNMSDTRNLENDGYQLYALLAQNTVQHESKNLFFVTTTHQNNVAFFAWLEMLNMNVAVILTLMMIVAAFTLISAMLMIVLERIRVIGNFKAMGATNGTIRRIFIYLTGKLILKALIIGNVIGIGLALLQKYAHIVRLDPASYYMPYVPIHLSIPALLMLNVGIIIVSYLTLLGASHIISTIKPTATMRFE